jgi:hypothetical protein
MNHLLSLPRHVRSAALTIVAVVLLAGCSGSGDTPQGSPSTDREAPPARTLIPTFWIDDAARSSSEASNRGFEFEIGSGARHCVLGNQPIRVLDLGLTWHYTGFEVVNPATDKTADFVHRCELSQPDRLTGEVTLARYPDVANLQGSVDRFRSRTDTPVQDNEVGQVTSGRYRVDTLRRWYPTNPQGLYQAMVVDEQQRATLLLEVSALSREDFEATSAQKVADALTDFLERSHTAGPVPAPTPPDWADAVWEDAQDRFRIAIAKGWEQDPKKGQMDDQWAVPRFVDGDSAAVTVVPLVTDGAPPLSEAVQKFRAVGAKDSGFAITDDGPVTLDNGHVAHRFDAIKGDRRVAQLLIGTGSALYTITCAAPADQWENKQQDMLRMARSFTARS